HSWDEHARHDRPRPGKSRDGRLDIVGGVDLTDICRPPRGRGRSTRPPAEGCRYGACRLAVVRRAGRAPKSGRTAPRSGTQPRKSTGDERDDDLDAHPVGLVPAHPPMYDISIFFSPFAASALVLALRSSE